MTYIAPEFKIKRY